MANVSTFSIGGGLPNTLVARTSESINTNGLSEIELYNLERYGVPYRGIPLNPTGSETPAAPTSTPTSADSDDYIDPFGDFDYPETFPSGLGTFTDPTQTVPSAVSSSVPSVQPPRTPSKPAASSGPYSKPFIWKK